MTVANSKVFSCCVECCKEALNLYGMIVIKQLIEAGRRDEVLKIFSFLEGKICNYGDEKIIN